MSENNFLQVFNFFFYFQFNFNFFFLKLFWDLCSTDEAERSKAALCMIRHLWKEQNATPSEDWVDGVFTHKSL